MNEGVYSFRDGCTNNQDDNQNEPTSDVIMTIMDWEYFSAHHHDDDLFRKFKEKMRSAGARKSFSTDFKYVATLGRLEIPGYGNDQFDGPFDVTVSYNHHCILVSDLNNDRIKVFDLKTKEYISSIQCISPMPKYLCIEEAYEGNTNDALLFDCDDGDAVYKYDLRRLLEYSLEEQRGEEPFDYIWKTTHTFLSAQGIAVCNHRKEVFVCDSESNCIAILNSISGDFIKRIEIDSPRGVFINSHGELLVTQKHPLNRIEILKRTENEEWTRVTTFGKYGKLVGELNNSLKLLFDEVSKNIIVSDGWNHRIQVFKHDGTVVTSYGTYGSAFVNQFKYPCGICLNEMEGELYVCDYSVHVVHIFK
ncbi:hypothetical protein C9374_011650 [Naegleria lovaniensis]|uniref:Uncharacterized protein n=1 Tax=Naegleria lovaniensis TaxID=51637 RepID=A0AA88KCN1_NAELO|nr:uncharacterized protein C9374_011650 [Naegleria lovaniensis]KAG2373985.1 hypothetical protein C9374_011650 [Naegleria lovaniensis]